MISRFLILGATVLLLTACPNSDADDQSGNQSNNLPETADNFVVTMMDGGGMLPVSYKTYISKDSAYWEYDRYNYETKLSWNPTEEEITDLYSDLRKYKFNRIKSNCGGEVFDRGGLSISIKVNEETYDIDNSGNCFIMDKWSEDYFKLVNSLESYRRKKIEDQILILPVTAAPSLIKSGYDIRLQINDRSENYSFNKDTTQWNIPLFPGMNEFIVQMNYRDSTNYYGSPVSYKYEQIFRSVSPESSTVSISWESENLVLEVLD